MKWNYETFVMLSSCKISQRKKSENDAGKLSDDVQAKG